VLGAVEPVVAEDGDEQVLWPATSLRPRQLATPHHAHIIRDDRHAKCHTKLR
jgi:hypothetical protein